MRESKCKKLKAKGWRIRTPKDFLGMSDEEVNEKLSWNCLPRGPDLRRSRGKSFGVLRSMKTLVRPASTESLTSNIRATLGNCFHYLFLLSHPVLDNALDCIRLACKSCPAQ